MGFSLLAHRVWATRSGSASYMFTWNASMIRISRKTFVTFTNICLTIYTMCFLSTLWLTIRRSNGWKIKFIILKKWIEKVSYIINFNTSYTYVAYIINLDFRQRTYCKRNVHYSRHMMRLYHKQLIHNVVYIALIYMLMVLHKELQIHKHLFCKYHQEKGSLPFLLDKHRLVLSLIWYIVHQERKSSDHNLKT